MENRLAPEVWVNEEEKIVAFQATPAWRHIQCPSAEHTLRFLDLLAAQGYRFQ